MAAGLEYHRAGFEYQRAGLEYQRAGFEYRVCEGVWWCEQGCKGKHVRV